MVFARVCDEEAVTDLLQKRFCRRTELIAKREFFFAHREYFEPPGNEIFAKLAEEQPSIIACDELGAHLTRKY